MDSLQPFLFQKNHLEFHRTRPFPILQNKYTLPFTETRKTKIGCYQILPL